MANRQDKKGRSKFPEGQFIPLPYSVVKHHAWRSLSGGTVKVYLELRSRYNGKNNGKLCLSMEDAADLLGMSKSTVCRAFKELEEKGFIVKTKQGRWIGRQAHEWRVTDKPCNGHLATRDWQNWQKHKLQKNKSRYPLGT